VKDVKSFVHEHCCQPCRKQKMSGTNIEDVKEQEPTDNTLNNQIDVHSSMEDPKALDQNDENPMPSPQQEV
jgi:hypothetical protein